jgi:uncharacterized protein
VHPLVVDRLPRDTVADLLWGALALMLVLEGLLPFVSPSAWREIFERATRMSDGQIRFFGLSSVLVGLLLLSLWR